MDDLAPLDPAYVESVISRPPFISVPGVVNFRELGSYPTCFPNYVTRPGFAFRSAEVSKINEEGKSCLRNLGITTIFDLRSEPEIRKYNTPQPSIEGIQLVWNAVFKTEDYSPEMMAKRFELYASGKTEAFMELYTQILDQGGPSFGVILRHIRDKPTEGFLFHCTAGKDRTGILAALLLKVAGVPDEAIAEDYALTRVGREPVRETVMARLASMPFFASNNQAALNMFTCRSETMMAFLDLLQNKYGGVEEYMKNYMGLSEEDIQMIRHNLLATCNPPNSQP